MDFPEPMEMTDDPPLLDTDAANELSGSQVLHIYHLIYGHDNSELKVAKTD